MLDKYFNGVIEQVYHRIGTEEKNIVMASYNNDFSVSALENIKRYQGDDNVFLPAVGSNTEKFVRHTSHFLTSSVP